jgi:hypothetical protein
MAIENAPEELPPPPPPQAERKAAQVTTTKRKNFFTTHLLFTNTFSEEIWLPHFNHILSLTEQFEK